MKFAALFVRTGGVYFGLKNVEPWDLARNAKLYVGPWRVIAHPPCERWGRYWSGGPSALVRRTKGDDGGCFESSLSSVRIWGGVLEHPEASHAWSAFGLVRPPHTGGWKMNPCGGWTCCVEQGRYGHPARKRTWLYFHRGVGSYLAWNSPPPLRWGAGFKGKLIDVGPHSREEAIQIRSRPGWVQPPRLSQEEKESTPVEFRDALLKLVAFSSNETLS